MKKVLRHFLSLFFTIYSALGIEKSNSTMSLKAAIEEYLADELDDAHIAKELATILVENILIWKAPTIATAQITSIIAYAFGRPNFAERQSDSWTNE